MIFDKIIEQVSSLENTGMDNDSAIKKIVSDELGISQKECNDIVYTSAETLGESMCYISKNTVSCLGCIAEATCTRVVDNNGDTVARNKDGFTKWLNSEEGNALSKTDVINQNPQIDEMSYAGMKQSDFLYERGA